MCDSKHSTRIDKWLWATRVFKTRSLATEACKAGKVKVAEINAKPSRELRPGDIVIVRKDGMEKTVKVLATLDKRVGANLVPDYLQDLTPEEEYAAAREHRQLMPSGQRPSGMGRPTKRQRRALEEFFEREGLRKV